MKKVLRSPSHYQGHFWKKRLRTKMTFFEFCTKGKRTGTIDPRAETTKYFFPDYVTEIIVEQTNRCARQKNSRNWMPVTAHDIKACLGVLIMMGFNPLLDM